MVVASSQVIVISLLALNSVLFVLFYSIVICIALNDIDVYVMNMQKRKHQPVLVAFEQ